MLRTLNMMSGAWDNEYAVEDMLGADMAPAPVPELQLQLQVVTAVREPNIRDYVLAAALLSRHH